MSSRRQRLILLAFAAVLVPCPAKAADPPAGIVMSVSGPTTPSLSAMAEIPAATAIRLDPATALTFLHYLRCQLVTVTGGTVTLTRTDFTTDGHIDNQRAGPCPIVHQLSGGGAGATPGGMVVRGISGLPPFPVDPDIVFVGSRASRIVAASILREGEAQPVVGFALSGPRATLPQGTPPLTPNGRYVLRVALSDQPNPVELPFIARPASTTGSLVVLRVD